MSEFVESAGSGKSGRELPDAAAVRERASLGHLKRGTLFYWLMKNYRWACKWLSYQDEPDHPKMSWGEFAQKAGAIGLQDATGKAPSKRTAQNTWTKVRRAKGIASSKAQKPKPEAAQEAPAAPKPRPQAVRKESKPIPEWLSQPVEEEEYNFPVLTLPKGVPWQPKKADTPTEGDQ
jgi:hypothetical protein